MGINVLSLYNYVIIIVVEFFSQEVGSENYSSSRQDTLDLDMSLQINCGTSALVMPSTREVFYPNSIRTHSEEKLRNIESGFIIFDLPHMSWRKIVMPVWVFTLTSKIKKNWKWSSSSNSGSCSLNNVNDGGSK